MNILKCIFSVCIAIALVLGGVSILGFYPEFEYSWMIAGIFWVVSAIVLLLRYIRYMRGITPE